MDICDGALLGFRASQGVGEGSLRLARDLGIKLYTYVLKSLKHERLCGP